MPQQEKLALVVVDVLNGHAVLADVGVQRGVQDALLGHLPQSLKPRRRAHVKTRRPRYGCANACSTRFLTCSSKSVQYAAPWDGRWLKVMAA